MASSITQEDVQQFLDILSQMARKALSPPEASKPETVVNTEDEREAGAAEEGANANASQDRSSTACEYFVDIKSEELRDFLRKFLKEVNVFPREDKPTVSSDLLFHYLAQFERGLAFWKSSVCRDPADPDNASSHERQLEILVDFLKGHYKQTIKDQRTLLEHGKIRFDLLWTLFPPNTIIYTKSYEFNLPRCLKLDQSKEVKVRGSRAFVLDCSYFRYDGENFGDASISLVIEGFRGEKKIRSLDVFPLVYHEKAEDVRNNLIQRGRRFMSLKGIHHREYRGFAFVRNDRKVDTVYTEGRIMVDAGSFKRRYPNYETPKINAGRVKEEHLLTCSPTVPGFDFGGKRWAEFAVDFLRDIHWDTNLFQSLVLEEGGKEIIRALIENHTSEQADQLSNDIVKGKGQGLTFLFHGPPGVGKTLTAEGVSDFLQRPLYKVSAGDLSTNSNELETELSQIFDLTNHWNAILLLDEADDFLEKRSPQSLERNGMVSVFLRLLEYFQGILVLTTNRVETFDGAVQSRINLPLKFKDLDEPARKTIWKTFITMSCNERRMTDVVSPDQLDSLARKKLNGWEIKKTVCMANSLATNKKAPLSYTHLKNVLSVIEEFRRDLAF